MVLPIGEVLNRFQGLVDELESEWPTIIGEAAQDAIALIEERITTRGLKADGSPLRPYTKPYQKFKGAPQNTKRGRTLGLGSSRLTGHTDYTLSGLWWKDIQVRSLVQEGDKITAIAGPGTPTNKKIMESLTNRDGFPLRMSEDEKDLIRGNTKNRVRSIVHHYFPEN